MSVSRLFLVLTIGFAFQSTIVFADENTIPCADIANDEERLLCYDRAAGAEEKALDQAELVEEDGSPIEARRERESYQYLNWFSITPHRPNYVLPISYNASPDYSIYGERGEQFSNNEIKLQLSVKTPLLLNFWRESTVWFAYTQVSYWQLYADSEASSPFRETNHEPEFIWNIPIKLKMFDADLHTLTFSLNHQSNGRSKPLSRSWNRAIAGIVVERKRWVFTANTWVRIDGESDDDNPNIEDYMGRVQLGAAYTRRGETIAFGLKNNLRSDNRSGLEINWSQPLQNQLKLFVQFYSGYGENLIDMEDYTNRIGIGIALTDWL